MLPSLSADGETVERFLREARVVAGLKTLHVARVYDTGRLETGLPYIVMEYLEGADAKAMLDERGRFPSGEAIHYVLQVCEALAEAHAMGVIHRDLKPANLFVTRAANGASIVKVIDFGIAKLVTGQSPQLTHTSAILGSPLYMSPEQMRNANTVDARSDIWSLGAILYRMLSGRHPFLGESLAEVCAAVLGDEPAPLDAAALSIPPALAAIVMKCLRKDPGARYSSVSELSGAIASLDWAQPVEPAFASNTARATWESSSAHATQSPRKRAAVAFALIPLAGLAIAASAFLLLRDSGPQRSFAEIAPAPAAPVDELATAEVSASSSAALVAPTASISAEPPAASVVVVSSVPSSRVPPRSPPPSHTQRPPPPPVATPGPPPDAFGKERK